MIASAALTRSAGGGSRGGEDPDHCLGQGHEEGGRHPLARDIRNQDRRLFVSRRTGERDNVVKIAPDLFYRDVFCRDGKSPGGGEFRREEILLDPGSDGKFGVPAFPLPQEIIALGLHPPFVLHIFHHDGKDEDPGGIGEDHREDDCPHHPERLVKRMAEKEDERHVEKFH